MEKITGKHAETALKVLCRMVGRRFNDPKDPESLRLDSYKPGAKRLYRVETYGGSAPLGAGRSTARELYYQLNAIINAVDSFGLRLENGDRPKYRHPTVVKRFGDREITTDEFVRWRENGRCAIGVFQTEPRQSQYHIPDHEMSFASLMVLPAPPIRCALDGEIATLAAEMQRQAKAEPPAPAPSYDLHGSEVYRPDPEADRGDHAIGRTEVLRRHATGGR